MGVIMVCGAECGATLKKVAVSGVAALTTTGVISGGRSWRCNQTGTASYLQHFLITASPTTVNSVAFRWDTLPTTAGDWNFVLGTVSAGSQPRLTITSAGVVKFAVGAGTAQTHPTTIVAGIKYRIEWRFLNNDGSGTKKLDVQIDAVAGTQATLVEAGSNLTAWRLGGPTAACTVDVYFDDWIMGDATGDYPFGAGQVTMTRPNGDGTHSFTAGDFGDDAGTVLSSSTVLWQKIDDALMPATGAALTASDWLEQIVTNTAGYLEHTLDTSAITGVIKGMCASAAIQAETAASAGCEIRINDNGTVEAGTTRAATVAVTTIEHAWKALGLRPSTGTAWTEASLSTLKIQWGRSNDATPDIRLDALGIEWYHEPVLADVFPYTGGGYYPN